MASLASTVLADTSVRSATIDYRLQRRRVLADYAAGTTSISKLCDAHPELLRVAKNAAVPLEENCPICPTGNLRVVGYIFGPHLGPAGRCVLSAAELRRYTQRPGIFNAYEVEVCPDCGWNHLLRRYRIETRDRPR